MVWQERAEKAEAERDTLRDLLVTCRIRCERAEKRLGTLLRELAKRTARQE